LYTKNNSERRRSVSHITKYIFIRYVYIAAIKVFYLLIVTQYVVLIFAENIELENLTACIKYNNLL